MYNLRILIFSDSVFLRWQMQFWIQLYSSEKSWKVFHSTRILMLNMCAWVCFLGGFSKFCTLNLKWRSLSDREGYRFMLETDLLFCISFLIWIWDFAEKHGISVSVNDFVIKAAALALREVPEANGMYSLCRFAVKGACFQKIFVHHLGFCSFSRFTWKPEGE